MHEFKTRTLAAAVSAALASGFAQAATITVTTTADGSVPAECTLRDAIAAANTNAAVNACAAGDPGQDQIVFAPGVAGTIALTNGQIDIIEPSVITGPGAADLTIDAGAASRHFQIDAGADAIIGGLTLINGATFVDYERGGAIYSESDLTLDGVVLTNNVTHGQYSDGGAVALLNADLTIAGGQVVGNQTIGASSPGGAIAVYGGGLYMTDAHVGLNGTQGDYSPSGTMDIRGGDVEIHRGQIFGGRTLGDFSRCAGVYVVAGDTLITESEFVDNQTIGDFSAGGGLYAVGDVEIIASTFAANGTNGAYGQAGGMSINGSATLVNSTISGNSAVTAGGGIYLSGYYNQLTLLHSTVVDNVSGTGAGGVHIASLGFSYITVSANNSIISDATGVAVCNKDFDAATSTNNLATDSSCGTAALIGGAPVSPSDLDLGPLMFNGGLTPTHALGPASAAIDVAADTPCSGPLAGSIDQRGEPRPGAGSTTCDVGAFEVQGTPPPQPELTLSPGMVDFGQWCLNDLAPPEMVTFINTGGTDLGVTSINPDPPPAPFGQFPGGCPMPPFTLASGDSCTRQYGFFPTADGSFSATLDIDSNDPNSPHTLTLEGAAEHAVIDVVSINFGPVQVGNTATLMLPITNTGAGCDFEVLMGAALPLPPEFDVLPGSCAPLPRLLSPGDACDLEVNFTPGATGFVSHANELGHDATAGNWNYTLEGTGIGSGGGQLDVSPALVDFGALAVGQVSAPTTVALSNLGGADLDINSVDTPGAPFTVAGGSCAPVTLAPGESCELLYVFEPTAIGTFAVTLSVDSSDPAGPHDFELQGEGVSASIFEDRFEQP